MVPTQSNYLGFIRALESNLPVIRAFTGSQLQSFGEDVFPVLDMSNYDPDSNSGSQSVGSTNYGLFGTLLRFSRGEKIQLVTGVPGKTKFRMPVASVEVHVYTSIKILHDQGANVDYSVTVEDSIGATGLADTWFHGIVTSGINQNLLRENANAQSVPDQGPGPGRTYIAYPTQDVIVISETDLSTSKQATIQIEREVYKTDKDLVDDTSTVLSSQV